MCIRDRYVTINERNHKYVTTVERNHKYVTIVERKAQTLNYIITVICTR